MIHGSLPFVSGVYIAGMSPIEASKGDGGSPRCKSVNWECPQKGSSVALLMCAPPAWGGSRASAYVTATPIKPKPIIALVLNTFFR